MINDDIEFFLGDPSKACRAYSDPLFLQDQYLAQGHNKNSRNSTATFVGFQGQVYAVTCRHVREALADPKIVGSERAAAQLRFGQTVVNMACWADDGTRKSTLRPVLARAGHHDPDIAICELGHIWTMIMGQKHKAAIDLDHWEPPPWNEVSRCVAGGYSDEHKTQDDKNVMLPMVSVVADLGSTRINDDTREFTLSNTLTESHNWFFSGMSGGPILATWGEDRFRPIGIIFEGEPSSREKPSGWAGPQDILIRGILLTPKTFAEWLDLRAPL